MYQWRVEMQLKHSEKRKLRIAAVALLSGLARPAIVNSKKKHEYPVPALSGLLGEILIKILVKANSTQNR